MIGIWLVASVLLPAAQAGPPTYDKARAAAMTVCDAIDANAYQSGLAFNPDGYRSYYRRSECVQRAAVMFRDLALCDRVRQRRSLLWSSWGHSPGNCRTLVNREVDADRVEIDGLRRGYVAGSMVLRDFRIERNGNGRDYDVIPAFEGTQGHGYMVAIEILVPGSKPVVIHSDGYYVDPRSALRLFIRQHEIKTRFPAFEPGRSYQVRAVAIFTLPAGGGSRFMSPDFLERAFPLHERTRSVTRDVRF